MDLFKDDLDDGDIALLDHLAKDLECIAGEFRTLAAMARKDEYRALYGHSAYLLTQGVMNSLERIVFGGRLRRHQED